MINFFKRKGKEMEKKPFVFTTSHLAESTANGRRIKKVGVAGSHRVDNSDYITLDSVRDGWFTTSTTTSNAISQSVDSKKLDSDTRKEVEPKAVFESIKKETPEISFENLDAKIEAVEERLKILKEHLDESRLGDEQQALFYLKNRRTYLKTGKKLPIDWAMTTQEAIDDLCKTYKLKVVPLQQFYTLVPAEGIKEMNRYTKAYKAITGDTPIFELVVKDTVAPAQKKKDRDPILLANSPLGNHICILGVWDDEVAIVDEIIYYGK